MNTVIFGDVHARTNKLLRTGLVTKDQIAQRLNSEFHVAAYVNKENQLFVKYMDEQERPQLRVVA